MHLNITINNLKPLLKFRFMICFKINTLISIKGSNARPQLISEKISSKIIVNLAQAMLGSALASFNCIELSSVACTRLSGKRFASFSLKPSGAEGVQFSC